MSLFRRRTGETPSKLERALRQVLFYGLIIASCLYIGLVLLRYQVEKEHENRLMEIRDAGFPAGTTELQDWVEALYPDTAAAYPGTAQNREPSAVDLLQQAFAKVASLDLPSDWPEVTTLTCMLVTPEEELSPEDLALIHTYVQVHKPVLELLQQAASLPQGRFALDYREGLTEDLPHRVAIREAVHLLRLANALAAREGDATKAELFLSTAMATVHPLVYEPVWDSQVIRVNVNRIILAALGDALRYSLFSDAQLRTLEQQYRELHPADAFFHTFISDRVFIIQLFEDLGQEMPDKKGGYFRYFRDPSHHLMAGLAGYLVARDRANYMRFKDNLLAAAHAPYEEQADIIAEARSQILLYWSNIVTESLLPSYERTAIWIARDKVQAALFFTAIALERYRLVHSTYPAGLDSLVPAYLDEIPIDPFDMQPLRYLTERSGYRIYAVGPNGTDNGGHRGETLLDGDIVFEVRHADHP